ncbi:RNA-dependent DNA polymerase, partial [bacterium]|nr:RNA-dependent DNA polymerase [bacterium]
MAKTYKNLYCSVCEFDNIHVAYIKARRLKRYTQEVLRFTEHLEENLIEIQNCLTQKMYNVSKYRYFVVCEPKKRLIAALPFKDRVVQHALCNIIEPIFERSFIYDSYACRVGKGVLAGVNRTTKFLRVAQQKWGKVYCLKMDIAKYFPSVDHVCLKRIIRKYIACADTLRLIDIILDSEGTDCGIP